MMLITDGLFNAFLKCKTKAHLMARGVESVRSPHPISNWQRDLAESFKKRSLDHLLSADCTGGCIVGSPPPEDLRNAKHHFVVEPLVRARDLESHIHVLERAPLPSQRRYNPYVPIRFIPSEKITKHHKLALAFDAFVLWQATAQMPLSGKIIHGLNRTVLAVKLNPLIREVASLVEKLRDLLADSAAPDLVLIRHCSECEFEARCRGKAVEKDDLSLLRGLTVKERAKQNAKGIFTVTQLAYTFRPRRRPKCLVSRREKYHHAVQALAIRDRKIHIVGDPELAITGTPVYLDAEGAPDRASYYLIGLRVPEGSSYVQHSLWADEPGEEEKIWIEFLHIVRNISNPVLIHYGAYETTVLKRLARRYGNECIMAPLSLTTITEQSINLLGVIYSQIYFPTYSNGLKDVARYLGYQWSHPSSSGLQALMWREQWEATREDSIKQKLIAYNREDCEALEVVTRAVESVITAAKPGATRGTAEANGICVHSQDIQGESKWRKFSSPIPVLEGINDAAHWDYQRDRVYVRNSDWRPGPKRLQGKSKIVGARINKVVVCSVPSKCPQCQSSGLKSGENRSKVVCDLRFGRSSVRRWVVKYLFRSYECLRCKQHVQPVEQNWRRGKYGWSLVSFLVYEIVELCIPQRVATLHANRLFELSMPRSSVGEQKRMMATFYEETRQLLLRRIVEGKVVHVDETPISTQGKRTFVWVFCNYHEVAYVHSETREAGTMQAVLQGFKGVLVSDFYTGYDSVKCPQQKCLIHLMRDLNDDMLKNPYDDELRQMVQQFGDLLKPMVETVDRHGLKKYFLKKYLSVVQRFYKQLSKEAFRSEVATRYKERFEKNRYKLFTFLSYDGVPWNNNNAEHAMKAFAGLREVIEGTTTPNGIDEYLILLSVCETCRYRDIDFLEFLCSREKDIGEFRGKHRASRGPVRTLS